MSKTMLAEVDGFTPCIDTLTQQYGPIVSIVFGRVWRYCQGDRGVCTASLQTIADELNISYRTVFSHVKTLVDDGYLEDLDVGLANRPHRYLDTGKANIAISIKAGVKEIPSAMQKTQPDMQNLQSDMQNLQSGMQNLQEKIQVKKEVKIQVNKESSQSNESSTNSDAETDAAIKAIEEVAVKFPSNGKDLTRHGTSRALENGHARDYELKSEVEKSLVITPVWDWKVNRQFLQWLKEKPPEQTVTAFAYWWYHDDWRGKNGYPPTVRQVMELWPQAFKIVQRDPRNIAVEVF